MATGSTPVRGRPYPLETDAPDVAADIHTLALNLDQVPNLGTGTTMPTTGLVAGDEFRKTTRYRLGDHNTSGGMVHNRRLLRACDTHARRPCVA
jgi:hypothetical protein